MSVTGAILEAHIAPPYSFQHCFWPPCNTRQYCRFSPITVHDVHKLNRPVMRTRHQHTAMPHQMQRRGIGVDGTIQQNIAANFWLLKWLSGTVGERAQKSVNQAFDIEVTEEWCERQGEKNLSNDVQVRSWKILQNLNPPREILWGRGRYLSKAERNCLIRFF